MRNLLILILLILTISVNAAQTDYTFSKVSDTVNVVWKLNVEPDMALYKIYRIGETYNLIGTIAHPDTIFKAKFVLTKYYEKIAMCVTAVDINGNESAKSDTVSAIFCKDNKLWADINIDHVVDGEDLFIVDTFVGAMPAEDTERLDLNADGAIDIEDRTIVLLRVGERE